MIKAQLLLAFLCFATLNFAQILQKPSQAEINTLPEWAQLMYANSPNVFEVDQAYRAYYSSHLFEKNYHTQYYKRWRRKAENFIQSDGSVDWPTNQEHITQRDQIISEQTLQKSGNWSLLGPEIAYDVNGNPVAEQSNIYSMDQSLSNPSVLYCGTEPGEIYRSNDEGQNWFNVSLNDPLSGGVNAIKIHPTNTDITLAGSGANVYRTADGGTTWTIVLPNISSCHELLFVPSSPSIAFAATNSGLYRSSDAGLTWNLILNNNSWDVKVNTGNANIIYATQHNPVEDLAEFYRSTNMGLTFTQQTTGWHTSTDAARNDGGARIAVTQADPNRVYAYLIGESKAGDTGYIGVYRSNDAGVTWTLPNGPAGGPYDANHQNLAIGSPSWQYHQGFYNCALMASNTNADEILVGGLNLYKSDDGGATFYPLAGYVGGPYSMHVDMQDFREANGVTWVTTDGGIYRSTDFFNTDGFEVRMNGIHGSDYWGFGQGWNQDITVGGLYHNGNLSSFDVWGQGQFLQLGGGEPASGYVNPGENRRVYSSDINGRFLPMNIGDPVNAVGFGIDPNESYWAAESSELAFDPRDYSTAYTGQANQLWVTHNKGETFTPFSTFGSNTDDRITYIEIAWSNPNIMYVCQQMSSGNLGKLWKTTDAGTNWSELTLPISSNNRRMLIQVDPADENIIFAAFASGGNGNKVFKSTDGGANWTNLSTSVLNNQTVHSIALAGGTNGGLYYATNRTIYYRNNSMSDWDDFGDGLPIQVSTDIITPFYRDGKIRLASYGKGIWESALFEPSAPIAQISVDKLTYLQHCEADTFRYVDHSILNHAGATWEWNFQGGTPSTASTWNADVTYAAPGTYLTTLKVTDGNGASDIDSLYVTVEPYVPATVLSEDFEGVAFPPANFEMDNPDGGQTWEQNTAAGGFGNSSQSMIMRGFDYWPGGDIDDIKISVDMTYLVNSELTFDVAYAQYADNYSDTLEILISTDCGATWTSHYLKGGDDLATAPDQNTFFTPAADQWRTDTVDLSTYQGNNDVIVNFRSITGWGNNVYVDNINLTATDISGLDELESSITVYPNPVENGSQLNVITPATNEITVDIYSSEGKLVYRSKHQPIDNIELKGFESGAYLWIIRSEEFIQKGMVVIQ